MFFSERVSQFIQWFGEQIDAKVGLETREYVDKHNDLTAWYKVHEATAQYGVLRNSGNLRRRVEARRERAANKVDGWRIIAPDENGEWIVGESEWPPLPPDWRR